MLYNKNNVRKTNDKKILHKVGKQWKVISVALLMAIGGGAAVAATNNTNANADATDNAYNDAAGVNNNTAAQAQSLENNNFYGGFAKPSSASASSKVSAKPSLANINYAPSERYAGNNASAASYKNNDSYDIANMNYYGPIVKGYVDAINAKYPEAVSLEDNYNDLQGKTNQAKSAANSYSATAADKSTAAEINAKAAAAHQTASQYTDSVGYRVLNSANGYMPTVSNDAKLASEDSVVASYATLISNINSNAGLKAQYSASADIAIAKEDADNDEYNAEKGVATSLTNGSGAINTNLQSAYSASASIVANEGVASAFSGIDASFVNSVAQAGGFNGSSIVSSAISQLASAAYNTATTGLNALNANAVKNFVNNGITSDANYFYFQATGQNSSVSMNYTTSENATGEGVNGSGEEFMRVVSDTYTGQQVASLSGINKAIANDNSALSSYANAISSANSVATSASVAASDVASSAAIDEFLGNDPQLSQIFGHYDNGTHRLGNYLDASVYVGNLTNYAQSEVSNGPSNKIANVKSASVAKNIISAADAVIEANVSAANHKTATQNIGGFIKNGGSAAAMGTNKITISALAGVVNSALSDNATSAKISLKASGSSIDFYANGSTGTNSYASSKATADNASSDAYIVGLVNYANSTVNQLIGSGAIGADNSNFASTAANASSVASAISDAQANVHEHSQYQSGAGYKGYLLNPSDYASASAEFNGQLNNSDSSAISSIANVANNAASNYSSESSASNSYARETDQDVTIAAQFNSYYNSQASSYGDMAATAKQSLNNFRDAHASNPSAYMSANSAYASASAAEPNDRDFAYAYGKNVLLNTPEFITVKKNAVLHSGTQYAKANSVEGVKVGDQFGIIKGVGFDKQGNVRYVVADPKGKNYYITANDAYVKNTYLAPSVNYTVTLSKDAVAHKTLGFSKDVDGTIAAGTQLSGYTVPTSTKSGRRDASYGVTRLQIKGGKYDGDYITTNCKYLDVVSVNGGNEQAANQQNTNPVQNTVNFAD